MARHVCLYRRQLQLKFNAQIWTYSARSLIVVFIGFVMMHITGCGSGIHCFSAPTITGQPAAQTIAVGNPAIFTVAAIGAGTVTYQWLKNGQGIAGANQASYVTPVSALGDSGSSFSVTVANTLGSLTSSPALLTVVQASPSEIRFVATTGDDNNIGTIDQPYQTIQHCASSINAGGTCEVRAGTYRETVVPNSGITITAYHFEPVTIDGSDPVSGWTSYQGSIYKTQIVLNSDDTNQIFVGNEMMTEARWPNGDDLFHVNWANAGDGTTVSQIVDSNLPHVDWTGAKVHLWSGTDPFGHETGSVTASGSGRLSIDVGQSGTCPYICPSANGYYYLFGALNALDVEREWFYDVKSMTLYFMAPGGANPSTMDVRSKQRPYAFDLRGKTGVTISNISIFASTVITDDQSSHNTLDRINARYVSQFTDLSKASNDPSGNNYSILQVHRTDTGFIINGTGNIVQNSTISFSAGNGIALEGTETVVRNNLIQNVDYEGDYGSGIVVDGNDNTAQYNTITQVGRQGIYVEGVLNEDISYNNVFSGMLLSRDGGEIYTCCNQSASGTRVHHNWLHDTQPFIGGQGDTFAMSGMGIDNGSGGFNVDQNVLWNNSSYNLLINGATGSVPNNNHIFNNTVPDNSSGAHIGITFVSSCNSTRIVDNQVASSVLSLSNGGECTLSNNNQTAPGATEMSITTSVGCNFLGCSSVRPPAITSQDGVTPCPVNGPYQLPTQ